MADDRVVHYFYSHLKFPYYELTREFRHHKKVLEKETSAIVKDIIEARNINFDSKQAAAEYFQKLLDRLKVAKDTLASFNQQEDELIELLGKRVQKLIGLESLDPGSEKVENQRKIEEFLQVLIDDYLVRNDHICEIPLKRTADTSNKSDDLEKEAFETNRQILRDLSNKNVKTALDWCSIHKSKLTKLRSTFEFKLRQAEFYSLLVSQGSKQAMRYLHNSFKEYEEECLSDLRLVNIRVIRWPKL